jgi:transcriptional regulator with XRE-family HTH domain
MDSNTDDERPQQSYAALGAHLHRLRITQRLSLRETARRADVDPTWLSRLEQGTYGSPDLRAVGKVARVLEVDVEELYVVAGLSTGKGLPSFTPYLRAKYDLPPEAVAQLEAHFQLLNDKYQAKGDDDGRNNYHPA